MKVPPAKTAADGAGDDPTAVVPEAERATELDQATVRLDATEMNAETELRPAPPAAGGAEPAPGDVISDRYRLERVLGEGGMGKVFLAVDLLYAREFRDRKSEVAIKFLGTRFSAHDAARMALQRETRKSQQLSHQNVVRVMHFDQHRGQPYMIMEFIRGEPLDEVIRGRGASGLEWDEALKIIQHMAAGLAYIHEKGLVHSDFKPNNVFLSEEGEAKILDLGIARAKEDAQQQKDNTEFDASSLGALTPAYASCEMFEGLPPDPRDDVYALACVAYELLTGDHPYQRVESIKARGRNMKPQRPAGLSGWRWGALQRGLALNRDDRLADVQQLAASLSGEGRRRKLVVGGLLGLTGAASVAAASLGVVAMKVPDPDQVFLDGLVTPQEAPLTASDQSRVERWLAQGQAYLEISRQEFEAGDLATAHHILRGGADNAWGAFTGVLTLTDSDAAREGVMSIVLSYADWARSRADDGDLEGVAFAACEGLTIHPAHEQLNTLAEDFALDC